MRKPQATTEVRQLFEDGDRLITTEALAELTDTPKATIVTQRCRGRGLPDIKIGRRVRYRLADVRAYLNANTIKPASG